MTPTTECTAIVKTEPQKIVGAQQDREERAQKLAKEKAAGRKHYESVALELQAAVGWGIQVKYSPKYKKPYHGFAFCTRFANEDEAKGFIKMLESISKEESDKFEKLSQQIADLSAGSTP
jgi:hypothetical protein